MSSRYVPKSITPDLTFVSKDDAEALADFINKVFAFGHGGCSTSYRHSLQGHVVNLNGAPNDDNLLDTQKLISFVPAAQPSYRTSRTKMPSVVLHWTKHEPTQSSAQPRCYLIGQGGGIFKVSYDQSPNEYSSFQKLSAQAWRRDTPAGRQNRDFSHVSFHASTAEAKEGDPVYCETPCYTVTAMDSERMGKYTFRAFKLGGVVSFTDTVSTSANPARLRAKEGAIKWQSSGEQSSRK